MRPFEWLLVLAFAPTVLLPVIPHSWRRRWTLVAGSLLASTSLAHVFIEGWRSQMVVMYILTVVVLVTWPIALRRQAHTFPRRYGLLVSAAIGLVVVLNSVFAGWLLPVVRLPQPTGPYRVGIVDRELVDQARRRRLMVSIWYPAATHGTPAPLTHHPDEVTTALADLAGLPRVLLQHLRYVTVAAGEGVPLLGNSTPFPVLVFSHGLVGLRLQNCSMLQELASWGYVVVAIDHTDAAAVTVFPDGAARFFDLARFGIPSDVEPDMMQVTQHVFPVWVADQRFVYDTIETWAKHDSMLAGKLDLTRIGSLGHSFGGATALEVCRVDTRCHAAVNMDGGLYGGSVSLPAVRPLLLMSSADSSRYVETVSKWTYMITNANDATYWLELPNSTHLSFTFTQLLSPLLVPQDFEPRVGLRVVDKYLRAFFDLHLRGVDAGILGPTSEETDVRWLSK